MQFDSVTSGMP